MILFFQPLDGFMYFKVVSAQLALLNKRILTNSFPVTLLSALLIEPVRDGSNPIVRVQSIWCIAYNHPSLRLVVNRTSWSTVLCSGISGLGEALAMVFH